MKFKDLEFGDVVTVLIANHTVSDDKRVIMTNLCPLDRNDTLLLMNTATGGIYQRKTAGYYDDGDDWNIIDYHGKMSDYINEETIKD